MGAAQSSTGYNGSCPVQPQSSTGYTGNCLVQKQFSSGKDPAVLILQESGQQVGQCYDDVTKFKFKFQFSTAIFRTGNRKRVLC